MYWLNEVKDQWDRLEIEEKILAVILSVIVGSIVILIMLAVLGIWGS